MVCAPCVESCDVLLPDTVIVPEVPEDTYPALTVGVTLCVADAVAVMSPVEELTEMEGFAVTVVAGVVAEPEDTDFDADEA